MECVKVSNRGDLPKHEIWGIINDERSNTWRGNENIRRRQYAMVEKRIQH